MGALAYLLGFITGILFLLLEKKSRFVRFHAMQSTILFGGIFLLNIALGFIYIPGVGGVVNLASFILWIFLMVKAFQGTYYKLPYVGEVADAQLKKFT